MYIERVPNRNSRPAILLRQGWREGKKVCKRTLANLTDWPAHKVEAMRRVLKDEPLVSPEDAFSIERSWPHGHVEAVLETIGRIGLDKLIGTKRTRERDLVLAMLVERLIAPCSKLATTRMWHSTTLAQVLAVDEADEDELYAAMAWLLARQARIEKKLAARHLATKEQGEFLPPVDRIRRDEKIGERGTGRRDERIISGKLHDPLADRSLADVEFEIGRKATFGLGDLVDNELGNAHLGLDAVG